MQKITVQQAIEILQELHLKYAGADRLTKKDYYTFEPTFTMKNGKLDTKYWFVIYSDYEGTSFTGFTLLDIEQELAKWYSLSIREQVEIIL